MRTIRPWDVANHLKKEFVIFSIGCMDLLATILIYNMVYTFFHAFQNVKVIFVIRMYSSNTSINIHFSFYASPNIDAGNEQFVCFCLNKVLLTLILLILKKKGHINNFKSPVEVLII